MLKPSNMLIITKDGHEGHFCLINEFATQGILIRKTWFCLKDFLKLTF